MGSGYITDNREQRKKAEEEKKYMSCILMEKIISNREVCPDIFEMTIRSDYIAQRAKPGQFINIKCCEGLNTILRRPISICSVNRNGSTITILFQKKGTGTEYLSKKNPGDFLDLIGPLGGSFDLSDQYEKIAVIGGGIGIFPLLFLLKESKSIHKTAFIGFRNKDNSVLMDDFKVNTHELLVSTDDGSMGYKGFITDLLEERIMTEKYDIIYTCGPELMMKKAVDTAIKYGIKCQASLEQRMGCGIGACLACACKIKTGDGWQYKRVCKDGPVFWGEEVEFRG